MLLQFLRPAGLVLAGGVALGGLMALLSLGWLDLYALKEAGINYSALAFPGSKGRWVDGNFGRNKIVPN